MKCRFLAPAVSGVGALFFVVAAHGQGQTVGENITVEAYGDQQGAISHYQMQGQDVTMENFGRIEGYGDQSSGILVLVHPDYDSSIPPLGSITINNAGEIETGLINAVYGSVNYLQQHGIYAGGTPWDANEPRTGGDITVINSGSIVTHNAESRGIFIERDNVPGTIKIDSSKGTITTLSTGVGANTSDGIYVAGGQAGVEIRAGDITVHGPGHGVAVVTDGGIWVDTAAGTSIETRENSSYGIMAESSGQIAVTLVGTVSTQGSEAHGVSAAGLFSSEAIVLAVTRGSAISVSGLGAAGAVLTGGGAVAVGVDGEISASGEYGAGLITKAGEDTLVWVTGVVNGGWQATVGGDHQGGVPTVAAGMLLAGTSVLVQNGEGYIGAGSDLAIRHFNFVGNTVGEQTIDNRGTIVGYVTLTDAAANSIDNSRDFISRHFADTDGDGVRDVRRVAVNDLGGAGSTVINSGTFSLGAADGAKTFDATSYVRPHAGAAAVALDAGYYDFSRDGLLQSQFLHTTSFANSGTIDLRGSAVGNTLLITDSANAATVGAGSYVANGGTIYLNTVLNAGLAANGSIGSQSDVLIADRVALGTAASTLDVTNVGGTGAKTDGNGILLVEVRDSANSASGAFVLGGAYLHEGAPAVVSGAYAYKLYQGGVAGDAGDGDWYLRSALKDAGVPDPDPLYQPGAPLYESYPRHLLGLIEMPTLQQRVGNRVWGGGADADGSRTGDDLVTTPTLGKAGWLRLDGLLARIEPTMSTTGASATASQSQLELGLDDILFEGEDGVWVGGINARYGQRYSNIKSPHGDGSIASTFAGFGVSATWYDKGGFYLDNQARVAWAWSDLQSATAGRSMAEGNSSWGLGLSSEAGRRFVIGEDERWTLTPQAQISYGTTRFADFVDPFGTAVAGEGQDLTLRLGLSLDFEDTWLDDAGRSVRAHGYGIANLKAKLLPESSVQVGGVTLGQKADWPTGELGVGGSLNLDGDKVSIYGEALVGTGLSNFGSDVYGQVKVGLRVAF